jgi:hypothetical protein
MLMKNRRNPGAARSRVLAILILLVPMAVACAGPARIQADNQIVMARYAIREAVSKDAGSYAPEELAMAVAKLEGAEAAKPEPAMRLAEQATVQARLASAVSVRESAKAQLAAAIIVQRQSETLRSETVDAVEETER